jgi:hypothetical protein
MLGMLIAISAANIFLAKVVFKKSMASPLVF